jgi:hypothetical protein
VAVSANMDCWATHGQETMETRAMPTMMALLTL